MRKICMLWLCIAVPFCCASSAGCAGGRGGAGVRACKAEVKTLRVRTAAQAEQSGAVSGHTAVLVLPQGGVIDGSEAGNTLEFSFDCLGHEMHNYSYELKHLNRDMQQSDLLPTDYIDGFTTGEISDYELSVNTQQLYTHYSFVFPNEDMHIKASGNYLLCVYEDGDRENRVAEFRFAVTEQLAGVTGSVKASTTRELNGRYQQTDVAVDMRHIGTFSQDEVTLVVMQNDREDNAAIVTRPTFAEPQRLRYENQDALIFEGGNEYRHFDLFSVYFAGWNVDRVRYEGGSYHAFLEPDENRGVTDETGKCGTPYIAENDNDGGFVINAEKTDDEDTEGDYMHVHWTLPMAVPFFDGTVYVSGGLFGNNLGTENRMVYDNEQHCYYLNALLKQGAYDYQYLFRAKNGETTLLRTEGSHWETGNTYSVYVWFRPFGARADRLIGYGRLPRP